MASLLFSCCTLLLWGVGGRLAAGEVAGEAQAPAVFVFGDSLVDPGNNNELLTLARADYRPHGIDFPEGTTGRFCNGRTVVDHLGHLLGLPLIPPFNNPATHGSTIIHGVNYGSAASGILNDTGELFGIRIPMDQQLQNFKSTIEELSAMLQNKTQLHIRKSIFIVAIGSNDYINNYLLPLTNKRFIYTPEAFGNLLIQQFGRQLQDLYTLGARKFLIANISPIGCIPNQLAWQGGDTGECVESTNHLASQYNTKLKKMVDQYNKQLRESIFLYWDTYSFALNVIKNYASYGFKYQKTACCGGGRWNGQIICLSVMSPCQNRSEYVFWDPYHPTDAFNAIASREAYQGNLQDSFPRNVKQLVEG
ncbi:GDSL esterase/lipase At5g08460-like [Phalaenopsis equestris]|uniref:GDSL esterase/lipase At5g08460-like n=1 Tax=Phalaenopsis equestris TaxID=78828 RepID=UPI0009E51C68|nr:GDSL esterase/lipase At5g08460-like [Phalaenopsis equestris]